jgi:hypothetical protein
VECVPLDDLLSLHTLPLARTAYLWNVCVCVCVCEYTAR